MFAAGGIGINVRMLDGETVITSVDPGSPAHKAGLRSGFIIQAIDGIREAGLLTNDALLLAVARRLNCEAVATADKAVAHAPGFSVLAPADL